MSAALLILGYLLCCAVTYVIIVRSWWDIFSDLDGAPIGIALLGPAGLLAMTLAWLIDRNERRDRQREPGRINRFLLGRKRTDGER